MIQFYAPEIEEDPALPEADSQHCVRVLRMKQGDAVQVIDGKGFVYDCTLIDPHPKHAMLQVLARREQPLPWKQRITVAVAPTKMMDRMEWLVEKLTEVGVNRFVPLLCRYSERKEIKEERLRKIAVSAMKQSLKATLPEIMPMTPIAEFIKGCRAEQKFVAYCDPTIPRRLLTELYRPGADVAILIGPEGDFSATEIKMAIDAGFKPVSLGDNRLRTETAALYAVSAFHVIDEIGRDLNL
ncbi:MAG: 16S rRNA (uracil(1498)-N(3))-methyltransferase [Clostridium sp.]|nr:16S rRNA (uracil(1498)-N(3))-methyltransferase [Clostridium sp.]